MKQVKVVMLMCLAAVSVSLTKAQSIEDGKKFLYYERYNSAKAVFDKLLAANPANGDAAYLLGQTYIATEKVADAKSLYQRTLMASPNNPLLIAAMGHIELLEGKAQDARSRFETAISLTQGKSIGVLNAVGFANVDAKQGDAMYAIDKLRQATTIKGFKDAEVYTNLGDAYRKMGDGGSAIRSYESALAIDPNYAKASYRIGKVYQTQGRQQEEIFMRYYNDAIAKDAAYAPAYLNLYTYFYETNVNRSAEYLDQYLNKSDDDPQNCYYRASMKFAQGFFQEAITQADQCIAVGGNNPYANLYGLKGYAYNRLGDSVNAKSSFELYLQKQQPEKVGPGDYATYARILLKFPGNDSVAGLLTDKAVQADTLEVNKVEYLKNIAQYYLNLKMYNQAASWYSKIVNVKTNVTKTDLYNAGYNYYRGSDYAKSIEFFTQYTQKFADDILGYYMVARSNALIDTTMMQGLAVAPYEKVIAVAEASTDSAKVRDQLLASYKYLIAYYFNIKRDKAKSLEYADKALAINPTDAELIANKEAISKASMTPPKAAPVTKTPAKPATKAPAKAPAKSKVPAKPATKKKS